MRFFLTSSRKVAKGIGTLLLGGLVCLTWLILVSNTSCSILPIPQFLGANPEPPITEAPLVTDSAQISAAGQIIYDQPTGKLWSMALGSDPQPIPLFRLPPGTFAFQPVWSAATQQVAYGYIAPDPKSGKLQNARLWVADRDGSNARPVVQPPEGFQGTYRDPAWSADGSTLWATVQLPETDAKGVTRFRSEVRRVPLSSNLATGSEAVMITDSTVIENGSGPAISPDGQWIAYLANNPQIDKSAIWRAAQDGSAPEILVAGNQFEEIYVPMRFSPDGRYLAFAAADAENLLQRTPPPQSESPFATPLEAVGAFFLPSVARAHGLYPADVWLVNIETGALQRLTNLSEDHPTPAWSPDGRYLAFAGVLGVYVVDVAKRSAIRFTDINVDGQIEWLEE